MKLSKFLFEAAIDLWLKKNKELTEKEQNLAKEYFKDLQSKYTEHLDPSAKNLVVLSFQTLKLLYLSIQKARNENLLPATTQWLTKQIVDDKVTSLQNVEEDYIPPLKIYQNNKERLPTKLNNIFDIKELNVLLNNSLDSRQREVVTESDLGKIAEMNGWGLYMPHTTAASCELGKTGGKRDTTWCTTVTVGRNLYLQYTGRFERATILFYVIKRGVNAEKQPFAKMSVGTVGDKILFDQGNGNITVNADNKNLTEKKFREVLGDETADFFLDKIREVIGQSEFKHPMKVEMEKLARDPIFLAEKIEQYDQFNYNDQAELKDLIIELFHYEMHPDALTVLAQNKNKFFREMLSSLNETPAKLLQMLAGDSDDDVRIGVAQNQNTPEKILNSLYKDTNIAVRASVARETKTPEILAILANDTDAAVRREVADNPNTTSEVLEVLARDQSDLVLDSVARNPNISRKTINYLIAGENKNLISLINNPNVPLEVLEELADDQSAEVRSTIAHIAKSPEILEKLARDQNVYVRNNVARNLSISRQAVIILAKDKEEDIREQIAQNPYTPPEVLKNLARDESYNVHLGVANNHNTSPEVLEYLAKQYPGSKLGHAIARNKNVTTKTLRILYGRNEGVDSAIAENPETPKDILELLAKSKNQDILTRLAYNENIPIKAFITLINNLNKDSWGFISLLRNKKTLSYVNDPRISKKQLVKVYVAAKEHSDKNHIESNILEAIENAIKNSSNKIELENDPEILFDLSNEPDLSIKLSVAKNPAIDMRTIANLIKSKNKEVIMALIDNPNMPPKLGNVLAKEYNLYESHKPKKISLSSIIFRN